MRASLKATHDRLVQRLLGEYRVEGYWEGELASSALATATAIVALYHADPETSLRVVFRGLLWLSTHSNEDGGWGDTPSCTSNISTTALVWAALNIMPGEEGVVKGLVTRSEAYLTKVAGGVTPEQISRAILNHYGDDQTFSIPILTMLAISGRLGPNGWSLVPGLPFELAAAPHQLYKWLQLPVVSYALPALIAIGQVVFQQRGTRNPIAWLTRRLSRARTLRLLGEIQPEHGGYLEAVPLTAFVSMSLIQMGLKDHPVVVRGLGFLRSMQRENGSWPIDRHLATWVTSLSVLALAEDLDETRSRQVRDWLLRQQYQHEHPYTHAAPGGWSWTPEAGGVPDADDTSGALLALCQLDPKGASEPLRAGARWLAGLQNRDLGVATFCRGWGRLPFDKSSPEITAHALAAFVALRERLPGSEFADNALGCAKYLCRTQTPEGTWIPLWFGHQAYAKQENPLYGTARVLTLLEPYFERLSPAEQQLLKEPFDRARVWLLRQISASGGFSALPEVAANLEETALAIHAICARPSLTDSERVIVETQLLWLIRTTSEGETTKASPIGHYFASLWYYERMYPTIFITAAIKQALKHFNDLDRSIAESAQNPTVEQLAQASSATH